jgi:uncharacterized protein (TIGR03086 family)
MSMSDGVTNLNLDPAARRLADLVGRVRDEDLRKPTPCPAYTLGDLIEHVGGFALAFTAAARKERGELTEGAPPGDAARLGDRWRERIARDLGSLAEAWRDPSAWDGMTRIAGMDSPAAMVGLVATDELVVHGWDVARATGQPYSCEPELIAGARQFLEVFASPEAPAGPEVPFGPSLTVPPGTAALDELVALAGRDPGWSAT